MATTQPTTPAGAAAIINYAWPEVANGNTDDDDWPVLSLRTLAAALTRMDERTG